MPTETYHTTAMKIPPTIEIANQSGLNVRTVQRYLQGPVKTRCKLNSEGVKYVVEALRVGRQLCHNQPRRYAIPATQLSLFDYED